MQKIFVIIIISILISACKQQAVQYPVSYDNSDDFMKRSQERGKLLLAEETELITRYIEENGGDYTRTANGFWISNEGKTTDSTARMGDYVEYEYQLSGLDNTIIYPYDEIGVQKSVLGKSDLFRGLHASLQLIEEGDSAKALLPSFLAYGGYGDRNKIGSDEPVVLEIRMIDVKFGR